MKTLKSLRRSISNGGLFKRFAYMLPNLICDGEEELGKLDEVALHRSIIDRAVYDIMFIIDDNTEKSIITYKEEALDWFTLSDPNFILICDCSGLIPSRVLEYIWNLAEKYGTLSEQELKLRREELDL